MNIEIYVCPLHERNTHFQSFYYMHIVEIPINKGANSYKNSCESNVTDREKLEIGGFHILCLKLYTTGVFYVVKEVCLIIHNLY